jgi:small neutral amino acid transporter SnatA (MarC family)
MGDWSLALVLAWGGTAILLFSATYLYKVLGMRVLMAVERLMGMLLVALSVQMLLDGVAAYLRAGGSP